jgi:hypothetical protein
VKSGTFSKHLTLVAFAGATAGQKHLRVSMGKAQFKDAPSFDPAAELTIEDETSAYRYFGIEYRPAAPDARRLASTDVRIPYKRQRRRLRRRARPCPAC